MLVTLTCPECQEPIEGVLYPLFGDLTADCPACGTNVTVREEDLDRIEFDPPADESDPWEASDAACRRCGRSGTVYRLSWESTDGGKAVERHECRACWNSWFVEGIDA